MLQPPMHYSKSGLHLTQRFEQCRRVAYQDQGGVWTIGWGHTKDVQPGDICTGLQALQWLVEELKDSEGFVNRVVDVPLTQGEFDALVDFTYNCGAGALQHSTMLALLNRGNYLGASNEFRKWDHIKGKESADLLKRRECEQAEFQEPDAASGNDIQIWPGA